MANVQERRAQLDRAIAELRGASYELGTISDAKAAMADVRIKQKQLRQIKREINIDMKQIRASYAAKAESAGSGGAALFGLFGKRGQARSHQASARRSVRAEQNRALEPYNNMKAAIDTLLLELDKAKLQIQSFIDKEQSRT